MQLLIANNNVSLANADTQPTSGALGYATDGNPSISQPATQFPAYHYNMVMSELCQAVEDANISLNGTQLNQLSIAILQRGGGYVTDTGAANALAVTLTPAPTSMASLIGAPIRVRVAHNNTGAATLNVNGFGAISIAQGGTLVLSGGELTGGYFAVLVFDGTIFQCVGTGAGPVNVGAGNAGLQATNFSQFASVKTGSGYQKLPGGLMIQWGTISVTGPASSPTNYSFPTSFANTCLAISICYQGSIPPTSGAVGANTLNQYQFQATNTASGTNGANFIAIGW